MNEKLVYWIFCWGVIAAWIAFAVVFLAQKKPPKAPERKRDNASLVGIALQGLGIAMAWWIRRPLGEPIVPMPLILDTVLAIVMLGIAAGSIWLVVASIQTLGKQWACAARLVEGHRLVTEGPYRFVRNPIYSGMFGILVATSLVNSHWIGLLGAVTIFLVGTAIRVRSEEKLLRGAFGEEFESYKRHVAALIPGLW
jgi:protein-S-isoprenylcysteine O-methyltransferase Ste14